MQKENFLQTPKSKLHALVCKHPYSCIFFLTCAIFWIFLFLSKTYPFGNDTLLIWDADRQYLQFYAHTKSAILDEGFWNYSWTKSLGGEMRSLFAYYCASPLYLLFLFVPKTAVPFTVILIIMLKYAIAATACAYCLDKLFEQKSFAFLCMASFSYAFMGYNVSYSIALSWLDGVMLLPLVVLGLERLISQKKVLLYIVSLALCIASNFYIGYMICIFSVMLYIAISIWEKQSFKSIVRFGLSSLAAGGISCVVWLPIIQNLLNSRSGATNQALEFKEKFNLFDLFAKIYTGTTNAEEIKNDGLPQIYIGVIMIFLAILYFANKNIELWKKIISFILMAILIASFQISSVNIMWHGFSENACYNYRYSFLLSFILIVMAYQSLNQLGEIAQETVAKVFLGVLALTILVYKQGFYTLNFKYVYTDMIVLGLFVLAVFLFYAKKKGWILNLTIILQVVMLLMNATITTDQIRSNLMSNTQQEYEDYMNEVEPAVEAVKEMDDSFYRMEKDFSYNGCYENEPTLFDYRGISHFSSTEEQSMRTFIKSMGFHQTWMVLLYGRGSTEGANDLLGIKYLLTRNSPNVIDSYQWKQTVNDVNIYENKDVLGVATLSDSLYQNTVDQNQPFTFLNDYVRALDATTPDIYTAANIGSPYYNYVDNSWDGSQNTLSNISDDSRIEYTFTVEKEQPLYVRVNCDEYWDEWNLYVNGVQQTDLHPNQGIMYVGTFQEGEQITVGLQPPNTGNNVYYGDVLMYYENTDLLNSTIASLKEESGELNLVKNTTLEGKINVKEDNKYLTFTIPYDKAWKITVDGEKVETLETAGALMAIEIPKGEHEYKLVYRSMTPTISTLISLVSLAGVVLYVRRKKKTAKEAA